MANPGEVVALAPITSPTESKPVSFNHVSPLIAPLTPGNHALQHPANPTLVSPRLPAAFHSAQQQLTRGALIVDQSLMCDPIQASPPALAVASGPVARARRSGLGRGWEARLELIDRCGRIEAGVRLRSRLWLVLGGHGGTSTRLDARRKPHQRAGGPDQVRGGRRRPEFEMRPQHVIDIGHHAQLPARPSRQAAHALGDQPDNQANFKTTRTVYGRECITSILHYMPPCIKGCATNRGSEQSLGQPPAPPHSSPSQFRRTL